MTTLMEILADKETDKVKNDLALLYNEWFYNVREDIKQLVEIGVDRGGSIEGWLEFFPNARVFALDTRKWTGHLHLLATYVQIDAGNIQAMTEWANWTDKMQPGGFHPDIVIDDGSHMNVDVINAFEVLWPFVAPGGWYIVEDIQVPYRLHSHPTTPEYFTNLKLDKIGASELYVANYNLLYVRKGK